MTRKTVWNTHVLLQLDSKQKLLLSGTPPPPDMTRIIRAVVCWAWLTHPCSLHL